MKPSKKQPSHLMPSLTVQGKRSILEKAIQTHGEAVVTQWLAAKDIPSIHYFYEQVRKYKAKLFRDLFLFSKP